MPRKIERDALARGDELPSPAKRGRYKTSEASGGKRPGAGRPYGRVSNMTELATEQAMATGLLPHEFLLKVMRGEPILHYAMVDDVDEDGRVVGRRIEELSLHPTLDTRIEAAKAAAPYFAAKRITQAVDLRASVREEKTDLSQLSDRELAELERLLAKAGRNGEGQA